MNTWLERIHHFDTQAFIWVNLKQGCHYRKLVRQISRTGDGPLYVAIGLVLFLFETKFGAAFLTAALFSYLFDVSLYLLLKNTIKRDRPQSGKTGFHAIITPSDKFSFPSGHTAAAFVFATLVFQFYPGFALAIYIWASLVGLSRVLLGVHYPGDIFAGAVLGTASAWAGIQLSYLLMPLVVTI